MLAKFNGIRDEELVSKYKENRDDDIEMELIDRYRIHSKKLAGELYRNYRYVFQIEYDDLYSICLANLFDAIRSFKKKQSFFNLWKTIATNDIKLYVCNLPLLKQESSLHIVSTSRDNSNSELVISSSQRTESSIDLSQEIEQILINNKDKFAVNDRDIFILYVGGYSITDIANETGLKYHYVRRRINIIKEKIEKYFVKL